MHTAFLNDGFRYYTIHAVNSSDALSSAIPASLSFFTKITEEREIRFVITSFLLPDGRFVRAVQSADHVPFLREVIEALEAQRG